MEWIDLLLAWYDKNKRDLPWRHTSDAYPIWISEIMLQQTRVESVRGYWQRFLAELPTVQSLADVEEDRLLKLWEGLGYYSRARNLRRAAVDIVERFEGVLPADYQALLSLCGIGEYTAGAIASIAYGIPVPAVDGNVLRVMARFYADGANIMNAAVRSSMRKRLAALIPNDRPGVFNQALMELGATVCLPNGAPHCEACPLCALCLAHKRGQERRFPVRSEKKKRRTENRTVFVLKNSEGAAAGYRRSGEGLLAAMWQLPDEMGRLGTEAVAQRLDGWGMRPLGEWRFYDRRHIFTHIEWHMHVCAVTVETDALPKDWVWLDRTVHSLPSAYRICL